MLPAGIVISSGEPAGMVVKTLGANETLSREISCHHGLAIFRSEISPLRFASVEMTGAVSSRAEEHIGMGGKNPNPLNPLNPMNPLNLHAEGVSNGVSNAPFGRRLSRKSFFQLAKSLLQRFPGAGEIEAEEAFPFFSEDVSHVQPQVAVVEDFVLQGLIGKAIG